MPQPKSQPTSRPKSQHDAPETQKDPQTRLLRLKALDEEDLKVVSACLQDALVPIVDMEYFPDEKRFVMVVSRLMWEHLDASEIEAVFSADEPIDKQTSQHKSSGSGKPIYWRIHCGITFEGVDQVKSAGINRQSRDHLLNILAITSENKEITILFSAGAAIRFSSDTLRCYVKDLGKPWPIFAVPHHSL